MTDENSKLDDKRICACGTCNEEVTDSYLNRKTHLRVVTRFKRGHASKLYLNNCWKGGRIITSQGYVLVVRRDHPRAKNNKGYVFEHILVMEEYLGRYLLPREEIHHINRNRQDNRIENLQLFSSHSEHLRKEHRNEE